jgi:glycerate-2-kinase
MLELPVNASITLTDLQAAHQVSVTCNAMISGVNAIRRQISRIKGGGLRHAALIVAQVAFIEVFFR